MRYTNKGGMINECELLNNIRNPGVSVIIVLGSCLLASTWWWLGMTLIPYCSPMYTVSAVHLLSALDLTNRSNCKIATTWIVRGHRALITAYYPL